MEKKPFFNGWTVLITGLLFAALAVVINVSPWGLAGLLKVSGGQTILDMYPGYTPDRAYSIFAAEGVAGRAFEMRYIMPLDVLFPIAYGLFFVAALTVLVRSLFPGAGRTFLFAIPGIAAAVCDLSENLLKLIMMINLPARLDALARLANIFTLGKFAIFALCLVSVFSLTVAWLVKYIVLAKRKKSESLAERV